MWQQLATLDWETNDSPLKSRFDNQRIPNQEAVLDRAYSAFTTWMACNASDDPDTAIQQFYDVLSMHIFEKANKFKLHVDEMIMSKVTYKARLFNTLNTNPQEEYLTFNSVTYRRASDGE